MTRLWSELRLLLRNRTLQWGWLLLAMSVVVLHSYIERRLVDSRQQTQQDALTDRLSVVRYQLESTLTNNLSLINGLAAFIASDPEFTDEQFETYARTVMAREPALVNLAVAPGLVVRNVYPLAGNEAALGLDYTQQSDQRDQVMEAILLRTVIIAGPVNLVQGGLAFIGRAPVFVPERGGQERLWGIVSAPVLAETIFQQAGLDAPFADMRVALRRGDDAASGRAFLGDDNVFEQPDRISMPVIAGGSQWQLAALPILPAVAPLELWMLRLSSFLVFALSSMLLMIRARHLIQNDALRKIIFRNERFLRAVENVSQVGGWRWSGSVFSELSARTREIMELPSKKQSINMAMFCHSMDTSSRQRLEDCLQHALVLKQRIDEEFELRRRDGEVVWLHIKAEPVSLENGQVELLGALQDITQSKKLDQLVEFQANYDMLTHLPNRALFLDRLQTALLQARRRSTRIAVLFVDLDNFKSVNDNLGHDAGDELLIQAAQRIQSSVRNEDTVARHSGDEFVALLVDVFSASVVSRIADQIVGAMREPFRINGHQIYCSVSIGASFYPDDGDEADTLVIKADQAMYEVKKSGRNAWQFYTAAMQLESEHKHRLYNDLVSALDSGSLSVFYQPVVDASTGQVVSCEALVRWSLGEGGWVAPDVFIPLAEERGLINRIDLFVLRKALDFVSKLNTQLTTDIALSVNVSPKLLHLRDDDAQDWLRSLQQELPVQVTIEITERVLLDGSDEVRAVLQALDSAGVRVAIDDFGTGYSGLSYFSRFPVSVVKIDRSFVKDLQIGATQTSLVETILLMAGKLNIFVVAEGVETHEQATFLRDNHCHYLQGFHIAPPMSAEEFSVFVRQNKTLMAESR
ncbi:bifunctional diguanylate cyclase/phosphodiesterase [Pseudohongiella spirulinae]|uniref:bifunctional diguanylate cyclase/phosphodiesterase n=1 Tax=Pseudohongiella spirulinae TaxID=1249552 RepID=UPI000717BB28|nr:EAL domain-containing protein [Pseudohongiella spirulinae]